MLAHKKPVPSAPPPMRMTSIYLDDELIEAIDAWRAQQEGRLSRSDAIRRLSWRAIKAEELP
jgi:hypothetical protein